MTCAICRNWHKCAVEGFRAADKGLHGCVLRDIEECFGEYDENGRTDT